MFLFVSVGAAADAMCLDVVTLSPQCRSLSVQQRTIETTSPVWSTSQWEMAKVSTSTALHHRLIHLLLLHLQQEKEDGGGALPKDNQIY